MNRAGGGRTIVPSSWSAQDDALCDRRSKSMYKRILVPLDGSETAEDGLRHAISLARGQPATLLLLHVLAGTHALAGPARRSGDVQAVKEQHRHALAILSRAREAVQAAGLHCETLLREFTGKGIAEVIVQQAVQHRCDLVVMATHGRSGIDWMSLGSEAQQVARSSRVPLLLIPPTG
jgi:nucleotide-binding universal stress UspA family protein